MLRVQSRNVTEVSICIEGGLRDVRRLALELSVSVQVGMHVQLCRVRVAEVRIDTDNVGQESTYAEE